MPCYPCPPLHPIEGAWWSHLSWSRHCGSFCSKDRFPGWDYDFHQSETMIFIKVYIPSCDLMLSEPRYCLVILENRWCWETVTLTIHHGSPQQKMMELPPVDYSVLTASAGNKAAGHFLLQSTKNDSLLVQSPTTTWSPWGAMKSEV